MTDGGDAVAIGDGDCGPSFDHAVAISVQFLSGFCPVQAMKRLVVVYYLKLPNVELY